MKKPIRVRVRSNAYALIGEVLEEAISYGLNRHDKYSEEPLSDASRDLLRRQLVNAFWVAIEEREITLTR